MAGASVNHIRTLMEGEDKSLGRTLKKGGVDVSTFSGKLKVMSQSFKQLIRGDFRGAGSSLKQLGGSFGSLGKMAGIAGLAVGVAIVGIIGQILKAQRAYEDWMQKLDDFQDVAGTTAKATSLIAFQARMADVDVGALSRGVAIFTKTLDGARRGVEMNAEPFRRLGIELRDNEGKLRSLDDVLLEARDKLSEIEDQTKRNGIAAKLFGRGFADMADWLDKSAAEMQEYTEWAEELGMVMGKKSMDAFQEYRKNQRKVSVGWDAIKINAYAALVPLINDIMPKVIAVIWKGAEWVKTFRKLIDRKGWGKAFDDMVPGGRKIRDAVKVLWEKAKAFGSYIVEHKGEIKRAFQDIAAVAKAISDALGKAVSFARWLSDLAHGGNAGSRGGGSKASGGGGFNQPGGDPSIPGVGGGSLGGPNIGSSPGGSLADAVWSWIRRIIGGLVLPGSMGGAGYGWASSLASRFGLQVSSTYRPGAITAAGYPSDHGVYGRAADIAGPPGMMSRLWSYVKSTPGAWKQAIYRHEMVNRGMLLPYGPSDHFDHVHLARATGDGGAAGEGGDIIVNVVLDGQTIERQVTSRQTQRLKQRVRRR